MFWVPPGFAHGFYVLSPWAEVHYRCTAYYEPGDERVLLWSDPALAIPWPLQGEREPLLSSKDAEGRLLAHLELSSLSQDA
jgi:dTDP-4-dehydrorhamnose 3,5-epimerase